MPNEPKWTPGPWHSDIEDIYDSRERILLSSLESQTEDQSQDEANILIAAAAPELYAFLEKIQREIGPFVFRIDGRPLAELIESALSKARGEQPHAE